MKLINRNQFSLFLLFLVFISGCKTATDNELPHLEVSQLEQAYEENKEAAITHRRFKHADLQPLIEKHANSFKVEELGKSVEGKSISSLDWGNGPTKVMLWSQMHGNESTATMALFDLFNFLEASGDGFDELRTTLNENLHIKFIPMINPDGSDKFQRRNALDIDLNRDAISQISPEAIILKGARDSFEPEFGFNLHDQQIYYNVVNTPQQVTISVLAPGYNYERDVNDVRAKAMQIIVGMDKVLQHVIPNGVGKYDDSFEPRAFGDNIQKWGTSTILIESGGYVGDPEKQYIRKLNFMIILNALEQIATKGYEQFTTEQYFAIPDNDLQMVDLKIEEMNVEVEGKTFPVDLSIRRNETNAGDSYYVTGSVVDLGDMQVYFGFEEKDATGLNYQEGKVYETTFDDISDISSEKAYELLNQGFLAVKVKNGEAGDLHNLPILVLKSTNTFPAGWKTGSKPNFYLSDGTNLKFAIVNGYWIDLANPKDQLFKQVIY
ncbi:M14 family zinc carboxypeptidase [Algoriphagus zhangzhouensis]|uniref:Zinc carboxypeptidase n=1 Tax=Algoriphagus zhangzhouensis TaxID=1073327 RepID=A0A1M7ZAG2_9BACT|nr:M14 family zinc carboxypeptidase [Algoriphagus zhangzhouensis]TDY47136.1 zinc carboxypeptidase [Algoriphagus zhangzhouensis]SHO61905.1 Zinc carboxypeptidase [Algoriphagus zhangzhouensis]